MVSAFVVDVMEANEEVASYCPISADDISGPSNTATQSLAPSSGRSVNVRKSFVPTEVVYVLMPN